MRVLFRAHLWGRIRAFPPPTLTAVAPRLPKRPRATAGTRAHADRPALSGLSTGSRASRRDGGAPGTLPGVPGGVREPGLRGGVCDRRTRGREEHGRPAGGGTCLALTARGHA